MGFYHVDNCSYLGGGAALNYPNYEFSSKFRKLLPNGEVSELQMMPTPKSNFAMTLWEERSSLFTLGGYWNKSCLK